MRHGLHEAFVGEISQRLRQRNVRDAQTRADRAFTDEFAGQQFEAHDRGTDGVLNLPGPVAARSMREG